MSSLTEVNMHGKTIKIAKVEITGFKKMIEENPSLIKTIKTGYIVTPVVVKIEGSGEEKGYRLHSQGVHLKHRVVVKPTLRKLTAARPRLKLHNPKEIINLSVEQAKNQYIQSADGDVIWPGIKIE